jgi:tetratricopeptide (TPR) repeat protein
MANDLERAARFYNLIFDIFPYDKDNNLKRNNINTDVLNMDLYKTYYKAQDYEKAKGYLQKLIDAKFNDPLIYIYMSNIDLDQKDTATALTYIEKGRNRFDDNQRLIDEEIRIYFAMGKTDILIEKLGKDIEVTPDNEVLYFTRGTLYGKRKEYDKAIVDYKKAIELKPDYFDANYNLGATYFNQAADKLNSISEIKNQDEYAKAKEKCEAIFNSAQPYFEKAHELNPKDRDTMNLLKQLYFRQNDMTKYNAIKASLEAGGK